MEGQGFVITDYAAGEARLSPVTVAMVEEQVGKLQPSQQFRIEPEPPIPAGEGLELMAVNCVRDPEDGGMMLVALLATVRNRTVSRLAWRRCPRLSAAKLPMVCSVAL